MDSETKLLLVGLAALAGGVTLGWYLKMQVKRGNFRSSTAGASKSSTSSPGAPQPFMIPAGSAPAGCGGCRG